MSFQTSLDLVRTATYETADNKHIARWADDKFPGAAQVATQKKLICIAFKKSLKHEENPLSLDETATHNIIS